MLQEAPDDRAHADILGNLRDARPQAADPPDHQVNGYALHGRLVQGADHARFHQCVDLGDNPCLAARGRVARFPPDQLDQLVAQGERGLVEQVQIGRLGQTGDLHEDLVDVLAQLLVGRQ